MIVLCPSVYYFFFCYEDEFLSPRSSLRASVVSVNGSGYVTELFEKEKKNKKLKATKRKSCLLSLHLKLSPDTSLSLGPHWKQLDILLRRPLTRILKHVRIKVVICLRLLWTSEERWIAQDRTNSWAVVSWDCTAPLRRSLCTSADFKTCQ